MAKKGDQKSGVNYNDMNRFNKYLNKIINDIMLKNLDIKSALEDTPFQNGISIKFDESGMPIIEGISNMMLQNQMDRRTDEMLVDVVEKSDNIIIDAELRGVGASDVKIETTSTSVRITASTLDRHYDNRISLPCSVDPESGKAVFNNGILEVTLNKSPGAQGVPVKISK
ncbi:MAG: Hsp20/alpha crystallin family protein [Candidatus Micrarchaeia archaeon]